MSLLGAVLVGASAFAPWWRREYLDALTGPKIVTIDGSDINAALVPMALAMGAAWAASAISRGWARRIIGSCVALLGAATVIGAVAAAVSVPTAEFADALLRPATAVGSPQATVAGFALAVIGGLAALTGGVFVTFAAASSGGRGNSSDRITASSYDVHHAPAARRAEARREASRVEATLASQRAVESPLDPEQLWRSLDVGIDLTDAGSDGPGHRPPTPPVTMGSPALPQDEETAR